MESVKEQKQIEAIYPLTEMQRSLLFHHLSNKSDQGLLHVQFKLNGKLDIDRFKQAWQKSSNRHPVLRTSIHWKKIQSPVQLVKPKTTFEWSLLDWTNRAGKEQESSLRELKESQKNEGVVLDKSPLAKITLIQTAVDEYVFLWLCHHILLDGWSTSIIIEDTFKIYEGLTNTTEPSLQTIPSYKAYMNWHKKSVSEEAEKFWMNIFQDFKKSHLFGSNKSIQATDQNYFERKLSKEFSQSVKEAAKGYQTPINTIFQGAYALVLSKYFGSNDIAYGTTVSGRSIDFPNIHLMTGMFMNVLPVRPKIDNSESVSNFMKQLQKQFLASRNYEAISTNQIVQWVNKKSGAVLYDSLFIFENFPWDDIELDGLKVKNFESGLTSTYPVTFVIKETASFEVVLLVDSNAVPNQLAKWILDSFEKVLYALIQNPTATIIDIMEATQVIPHLDKVEEKMDFQEIEAKGFAHISATTQQELQLTKIWESVLGIHPISIEANFFDLGGKSIQAVRMFSIIEHKLGIKNPPTLLIENPTIAKLAIALYDQEKEDAFKYLVPIKSQGSKSPLFCIHAGGGHVFFYKPLSDKLPDDRPVYGVQSSGVSNFENIIGDVEQMAEKYIKEMRLVQPQGPLNVLVYCFSTAVGVEMACYLEERGEHINLIVMDSAAQHKNFKLSYTKLRTYGFLNRFFANPFRAIYLVFSVRIRRSLEKTNINTSMGHQEVKTEKVRSALRKAHDTYEWKKIKSDIWLILLPSVNKMYNPFIIKTWKDLVMGKLNIIHLKNITHFNAFEGPSVEITAEGVEGCIID